MKPAVLDASALLAFLRQEPGSSVVQKKLLGSMISAVNLSEVFKKIEQRQGAAAVVKAVIGNFQVKVDDFDMAAAEATARLNALTKTHGLSFADRACLALAADKKLPVLTSDRRWSELPLDIEIIQFRGPN